MLNTLFSWRGRVNRGKYFLCYAAIAAVFFALVIFLKDYMLTFNAAGRPEAAPLSVVSYLILLWCQYMLTVKRGHDIGISGIVTFLFFLAVAPFTVLAYLIIPGNGGPNKYGEQPK